MCPRTGRRRVLSALLQGKRRQRVEDFQIDRFLDDLGSFHVVVEESYPVARMAGLRRLADRYGLTAYDAAYLDVARRRGLALATLDERLRNACRLDGVALV